MTIRVDRTPRSVFLHHLLRHLDRPARLIICLHMTEQYTTTPAPISDELADHLWGQRCGVLYKVWVQVRYHRRRQRFFDLVDKGTKGVTLILGASVFGPQVKNYLPWVATGLSGLGLLALVFGYGDRKQSHKELAEQAATLVAAIEAVPAGELTPAKCATWNADYARLCTKAPPPLKTLTLICEHEQAVAEGNADHVKRPGFHRRLVADFIA